MNRVIYFTRIPPDPWGCGGHRRNAQMEDLLRPLGSQTVVLYEKPDITGYAVHLVAGLRGRYGAIAQKILRRVAYGTERIVWHPAMRAATDQLQCASYEWARHVLQQAEKPALVFLDDPVYAVPLLGCLGRLGIPVVACSQNIETLSRPQVVARYQLTALARELSLLSSCARVITISREEATLLTSTGAQTHYLPYFPRPDVQRKLSDIRIERKTSTKDGILLLGGLSNVATAAGMRKAVQFWIELRLADRFGPLHVAGTDTERFCASLQGRPDQVVSLGPLTHDALHRMLAQVRAMLCYQEHGSGALTKITDQLLAGVPVIANRHAARSYHGSPGLIEFEDLKALPEALALLDTLSQGFPPPSEPYTGHIVADLQELLAGVA